MMSYTFFLCCMSYYQIWMFFSGYVELPFSSHTILFLCIITFLYSMINIYLLNNLLLWFWWSAWKRHDIHNFSMWLKRSAFFNIITFVVCFHLDIVKPVVKRNFTMMKCADDGDLCYLVVFVEYQVQRCFWNCKNWQIQQI